LPSVGAEVTEPSGLKYRDLLIGSGPQSRTGDTLEVRYTGTLPNGKEFDSSYLHGGQQPFRFRIGMQQVIRGWDEGLATMHVGGKRHLVIPPTLGYGSQPVGDVIPANSTLIFDVELVGIDPSSKS
jgi:peptidylprolyl isomerase